MNVKKPVHVCSWRMVRRANAFWRVRDAPGSDRGIMLPVKHEAVLKATAVRSPLPAGNVVDSSLSSLSSPQGGGSGRGRGVW